MIIMYRTINLFSLVLVDYHHCDYFHNDLILVVAVVLMVVEEVAAEMDEPHCYCLDYDLIVVVCSFLPLYGRNQIHEKIKQSI
jgi:hypothetical protein